MSATVGRRGGAPEPCRRAPARPLRAGRRGSRAQGMVEFAFVFPIVVLLVFMAVDAGRLIYAYNAIASAAREGARLVALRPQLFTDCLALQRVKAVGQAFPLVPDPSSVYGNTDPNNPGSPGPTTNVPVGVGYIYIWPAVSTTTPQDATSASGVRNCDSTVPRGGTSGTVKNVAVEIRYHFHPVTPVIGRLLGDSLTVTTISVVQTEY